MSRPRIALIHATPVAIEPIKEALAATWPEAEPINILEDSLSPDLAAAGELTECLTERIVDLAFYAQKIGSDGILYTCSSFGPAIEKAAGLMDVPVLKPNEAMFEAAIRRGGRTAMIATFKPAQASMEAEFKEEAQRLSPEATIETFVVEPAMTALRAGDAETHNRLVAEKARELSEYDAIVLAHFSTARAATAVRSATNIPVLTSPDAAVAKLKRLVASGH
ncbi:arylsulfatase [Microvirga sp. KLBC 81]|uniref:aspartate/glutamate racemase family protein n=1 Tax=Microvirga sp. KLBC 81 TaxID=1862707 RepID=UPI000D50CA4A|nr:aspartate/glutamate racemase family protein [Microvirga sp. KLBC 81]PVE24184.1 arylsulfatase [Microvirga sp. KLBC 81]